MNGPHPPEDPWWDYAHNSAHALLEGTPIDPIRHLGPVLHHGETAYLEADIIYSRLMKGPAQPHQQHRPPVAPVLANSVKMMAISYAAQGMANRRAERAAQQAEADRAAQWQFNRHTHAIVTDQRVLTQRADGGWNGFWYSAVKQFDIDLNTRSLAMAFDEDGCAPLRLEGHAVPAIALWAGRGVYGDQEWAKYGELNRLLTPSAAETHRRQQQLADTRGLPMDHRAHHNPTPDMVRAAGYAHGEDYRYAHQQVITRRTNHERGRDSGGLEL